MTYEGRVLNGQVVLDEPTVLPEGAKVRIEMVDEATPAVRSLREGLLKFAGSVKGLPSDMARNHDHYLHGAPKK